GIHAVAPVLFRLGRVFLLRVARLGGVAGLGIAGFPVFRVAGFLVGLRRIFGRGRRVRVLQIVVREGLGGWRGPLLFLAPVRQVTQRRRGRGLCRGRRRCRLRERRDGHEQQHGRKQTAGGLHHLSPSVSIV